MIRILFVFLLLSCIFDPADTLFRLKVPLFAATLMLSYMRKRFAWGNKKLFSYFLMFSIFLPSMSYLIGNITNADFYTDSTTYISIIKPYLFLLLSFTIAYSIENIKFSIQALVWCLLCLSIVIVILFSLNTAGVLPFELLYYFGNDHVIFTIGERSFGGFTINRVYFHSSPMLVFSLCYFLSEYIKTKKKINLICLLLTAFSLFVSGTRNNMMMAIVPFVFIAYINGSKKIKRMIIITSLLVGAYIFTNGILSDFTDKSEASNEAKLSLVPDYLRCYSNPRTLLLGDGIGSLMQTKLRGLTDNNELSYFELLRRFGIIGFFLYLSLMLKPIKGLLKRKSYNWMGIAYMLYLVMIFSNPFFFSSNGMIILSIVLAVYYNRSCRTNT